MSWCPCARYAHSYLKANHRVDFITQPDVALRETHNECARAIGPNDLIRSLVPERHAAANSRH